MDSQISIERYLILFIPWLVATFLKDNEIASYLIAWLGSFFIFYLTLTGSIKPLPEDLPLSDQLMRPIFLTQIIFAAYMCCTSIFYFFDVLGYADFSTPDKFYLIDAEKLKLTAQCQRYYCLAHAAFVSGLLVFMKYPVEQKYEYERSNVDLLIFNIALILVVLSYLLTIIPGLSQFAHQLSSLSFIAGTLALAFALPERKLWTTTVCLTIYGFNFYQALISGYKEPIILNVLILGVYLYPNYKKSVTLIFVPLLLALFIVLPTYNRIFRQNAWSDGLSPEQAAQVALNLTLNDDGEDSNWAFLTNRLSEMDMLTKYVGSTPDYIDYYGTQLLRQSLSVLVPRFFWPGKPVTEVLVMERVYKAGVVSRNSRVSAKPAFIADAYLSGGIFGILISLFIFGAVCQLIAIKAEQLFGGYVLGTALVFTGLFQMFWRGLSFEFLVNSVFWSYITMYLIFWVFKKTNILKPV